MNRIKYVVALLVAMCIITITPALAATSSTTTDATAVDGGIAVAGSNAGAIDEGQASADATAVAVDGAVAVAESGSFAEESGIAGSTTYAVASDDAQATAIATSIADGKNAQANSESDAISSGEGANADANSAGIAHGKNTNADASAEANAECNDDCAANADSISAATAAGAEADTHSNAIATGQNSKADASSTARALKKNSNAIANSESDANAGGRAGARSDARAYGESSKAESATGATADGEHTLATSRAITRAGEDSTAIASIYTEADATHSAGAKSRGTITADADQHGADTHVSADLVAGTGTSQSTAIADVHGSSYTEAGGEPAAGVVIEDATVAATGHDSLATTDIEADASAGEHVDGQTDISVHSFAEGLAQAMSSVFAWANNL
jgi:hypothetical protein